MPPDFIETVKTIAALLSAPLGGASGIFVYLYFRERNEVKTQTDARLSDKESAADKLATERNTSAEKLAKEREAWALALAQERKERMEDSRAYARELKEERDERDKVAEQYTDRIIENTQQTIQAAGRFESVLDVLGEYARTRGRGVSGG